MFISEIKVGDRLRFLSKEDMFRRDRHVAQDRIGFVFEHSMNYLCGEVITISDLDRSDGEVWSLEGLEQSTGRIYHISADMLEPLIDILGEPDGTEPGAIELLFGG